MNVTKLTLDFFPHSHIKLVILQLLPCWDIQSKAAVSQDLNAADGADSAVFSHRHIAESPEGVGVPVWTFPRWTDLFEARLSEIYFESLRFGGL